MAQQYQLNKSGLQAQLEAGVTFKKSTAKSEGDLEFVPVNLHIQEMKVMLEGSDNKGNLCCNRCNCKVLASFVPRQWPGGEMLSPLLGLSVFSNIAGLTENVMALLEFGRNYYIIP